MRERLKLILLFIFMVTTTDIGGYKKQDGCDTRSVFR